MGRSQTHTQVITRSCTHILAIYSVCFLVGHFPVCQSIVSCFWIQALLFNLFRRRVWEVHGCLNSAWAMLNSAWAMLTPLTAKQIPFLHTDFVQSIPTCCGTCGFIEQGQQNEVCMASYPITSSSQLQMHVHLSWTRSPLSHLPKQVINKMCKVSNAL